MDILTTFSHQSDLHDLLKYLIWSTGATLLLLIGLRAKFFFENIRRIKPQVDVPILNLKGYRYEAAKQEYLSDLPKLLAKGYAQVRQRIGVGIPLTMKD